MSKRLGEVLGPLIAVTLFGAALFILYGELRGHHYHDVVAQIRGISSSRILFALLFTALSYASLTIYDRLALHHLGRSIPYLKVAFTSFTTYTISHNLGFSLFTGGSIRYRLYTTWGLSAQEIAQLVGFGVLTFWLGYLTTSVGVFLYRPLSIPSQLNLPFESTWMLGIVICCILLAYIVINFGYRKPFQIRGHVVALPTPGMTGLQILVGAFDWVVAAAALWILLPDLPGITYQHVLGIYLIAQIAGLTSNIPGGLGVFETVFVVLLGQGPSSASVLASLFAYRIVYYLIPFGVAAILLGSYEMYLRRRGVTRVASFLSKWTRGVAPHFFSVTVFLSGIVLLISGATPSIHGRMAWLDRLFPLPVIELSHFLGSLIGVALLLLARGLQRRIDIAWIMTLVLLAFGVVVSLAKGADYEEATILGVMLIILIPARSLFYRKSSLIHGAFSQGWILAIAIAVLSIVWLTAFSYKHLELSRDLWWQFGLTGDAPRSWRALTGVIAILAAISISRLF